MPLMGSRIKRLTILVLVLLSGTGILSAQEIVPADSIPSDSAFADSIGRQLSIMVDTATKVKPKKEWSNWRPNPKRALWLALVIPGGGQIYNRKYWKLPLIYGGFLGCLYAMNWNNSQYKDYSQAYLDLSDKDPSTASYNKFLHRGMQITPANAIRISSGREKTNSAVGVT